MFLSLFLLPLLIQQKNNTLCREGGAVPFLDEGRFLSKGEILSQPLCRLCCFLFDPSDNFVTTRGRQNVFFIFLCSVLSRANVIFLISLRCCDFRNVA